MMNKVFYILSLVIAGLCLGHALLFFAAIYFIGGLFAIELLQSGIIYLMVAVLFYYFSKFVKDIGK